MFPADSPMTMIDGVLVKLDKSLLRPKYQHGDPIQIRFIVENQRRDSIYVVTSERRFGCFPESNHHVLSFDKNYYQDEAFDFPALWRLKPQDSVILEGTYSVIAYSDEGLHTFKLSIGYLTEEALQKINDQISQYPPKELELAIELSFHETQYTIQLGLIRFEVGYSLRK